MNYSILFLELAKKKKRKKKSRKKCEKKRNRTDVHNDKLVFCTNNKHSE